MEKLTEYQKWCLEKIRENKGKDWFDHYDLPYPEIKRSQFVCKILEKKGYLESDVFMGSTSIRTMYRIPCKEMVS